jgi:hypothetical protein
MQIISTRVCQIKSQGCLCETWFFVCSTSPLPANLTHYSHLQYMNKPLHKITSYTESIHTSYKPITPVNQLAPRGPVISYTQVSMRFEVLTLLSWEMWRCKNVQNFRKNITAPSSVYLTFMMTAFFNPRLYSNTEIFQKVVEFYRKCVRFILLLITQNTRTLPKSRKYTRLDGNLKRTDYLEGLGIDGRWNSGTDPPSIHNIYQNFLFLLSALFPVM